MGRMLVCHACRKEVDLGVSGAAGRRDDCPHCRAPLHFLIGGRPGTLGAVWMGIEHGGICVGCCTGLMLALFALGVMSLVWMAIVAVAILVEKVLPGGEAIARLLAVALIALGIWVGASPTSVPGLTQPNGMSMQG